MRLFCLTFLLITGFSLYASPTIDHYEYKPDGKSYQYKGNRLYYALYTELSGEKLTILYRKNKDGKIFFKGCWITKDLVEKLPMVVVRYICKYIVEPELNKSQSLNKAIAATKNAIEKALDQKYKNLILSKGPELVQDSAYFKGHFNSKWWMPNYYYDFVPAFSHDTVKTFLTNSIVDDRFPGLKYVIDTLKNFNYHHDEKELSKWGGVFTKVRTTSNERTIKDYGFVKSALENDHHKRSDSCRFTLKKTTISHGKKYPTFASVAIFGWHATYCNQFASDLRKSVFGNAVFETEGCKKDYETLKRNLDFVKISKEEIYAYANAGYFVFMIDKGHIATAYPDGQQFVHGAYHYPKHVAQAGASTGIVDLTKPWSDFVDNDNVISYLYLGYLK